MTEKRNKKGQFNPGDNLTEQEKQKMSASQTGNQHAKKLTTLELKNLAFKSYLEHLGKGKSKKSWWYESDELTLTWQCMDTYIKNEPSVFTPLKIETAKSKGYNHWEQVAEESAKGINKDANTASLQMVMRNKFGWDKEDQGNKNSNETIVAKFLGVLDKMDNSNG